MSSFAQYLKTYNIDPIRLAVVADVRYLTIWNASKGKPISHDHAKKILRAVVSVTGIPYTGPLPLLEAVEDLPTMPVKKITQLHRHRTISSWDGRRKS